jgi:hypothetical protein
LVKTRADPTLFFKTPPNPLATFVFVVFAVVVAGADDEAVGLPNNAPNRPLATLLPELIPLNAPVVERFLVFCIL